MCHQEYRAKGVEIALEAKLHRFAQVIVDRRITTAQELAVREVGQRGHEHDGVVELAGQRDAAVQQPEVAVELGFESAHRRQRVGDDRGLAEGRGDLDGAAGVVVCR